MADQSDPASDFLDWYMEHALPETPLGKQWQATRRALDLSRLWDGVAMWVALTYIRGYIRGAGIRSFLTWP
jgi:hypothetical protein